MARTHLIRHAALGRQALGNQNAPQPRAAASKVFARNVSFFPFFVARKARSKYAQLTAIEKAEFWSHKGKIVLRIAAGTGVLLATIYLTHLEEAPVSGRKRFMLFDLDNEIALGNMAAQETILSLEARGGKLLSASHPTYKRVAYVWNRLLVALPKSGVDQDVSMKLQWNLNVVDRPDVNAFVVQDGSAFVFTGLLEKECQGEDGHDKLAIVLGHEMAHALQRHGGERLSHGGLVSVVCSIVTFFSALFGLDTWPGIWNMLGILNLEEAAINIMMTLPHSRVQENEADRVGLFIAAAACYEPLAAPKLWNEWNKVLADSDPSAKVEDDMNSGLRSLVGHLSTHPLNKTRAANLKALCPEASKLRSDTCSQAELEAMLALQNTAAKEGDLLGAHKWGKMK